MNMWHLSAHTFHQTKVEHLTNLIENKNYSDILSCFCYPGKRQIMILKSTCDISTHLIQPQGEGRQDLRRAALQKSQSPSPWRIPGAFLASAVREPSSLEELLQEDPVGGRRRRRGSTSPTGRPTFPRWQGWEPFNNVSAFAHT